MYYFFLKGHFLIVWTKYHHGKKWEICPAMLIPICTLQKVNIFWRGWLQRVFFAVAFSWNASDSWWSCED